MSNLIPAAADVWPKIVDLVKNRVVNRSLWETLESTVPLCIEDDLLIVGLHSRHLNKAGHMMAAQSRNTIERAIEEVTRLRLRLRVIEGESVSDWLATKQREAHVAALKEQGFARKDREASQTQDWDALYDYVARAWSGTSLRGLPQSKARYLSAMLYALAEALDTLYGDEPDEQAERHLAKILERVATNAEVPATLVALELDRLRAWRRANSV